MVKDEMTEKQRKACYATEGFKRKPKKVKKKSKKKKK
jgi:hypothetical protein